MLPLLPALVLGTPRAPAATDRLPSGNGFGVLLAVAEHGGGPALVDFRDHLYQQYSPSQEPGWDLMYDARFGLADEAGGRWLLVGEGPALEPGTGILVIERQDGDLRFTERAFAPMALPWPGYVHLLTVRNEGTQPRRLRLFSLLNHHLGSPRADGNTGRERIAVSSPWLREYGEETGLGMSTLALAQPESWSCDQVWRRLTEEGVYDGRCGSLDDPWLWDDQVGGFQWGPIELGPGEEWTVGQASAFFDRADPSAAEAALSTWRGAATAEELLTAERAGWAAWHAGSALPGGLRAEEEAVARQSLTFLKMAQVREAGAAHGQLPASFPSSLAAEDGSFAHLWNIAWVRDGAYAIVALARAGHAEEARAALAFLLQDKAGGYAHLLGRDYGLSVCRLYGDGSEWSDDDGTGPNIELDNFGLFLWAMDQYTAASGDDSLWVEHEELVFGRIADVLSELRDEAGLVVADSSIWERHWNGNQQQFAYTQAWAVAGLEAASRRAAERGQAERSARYATAVEELRAGVCAELVDPRGVLAASREQLQRGVGYLDLAAVDAFNNGTLDPAGAQGTASLAAWMAGLATTGGGYARNDDGDLYDQQEWVWADLRLAQALRRACREDEARAIEDRLTAMAAEADGVLPELLDPATAAWRGPAPMLGFGAGLYLLNLLQREESAEDCADGVGPVCPEPTVGEDTGGDEGEPDGGAGEADGGQDGQQDGGGVEDRAGCGCGLPGGAPGGPGPLLLGLLPPALALLRRRRACPHQAGGRG